MLVGNEDDGDPPYLRAEVEWLGDEEVAEEAAGGATAWCRARREPPSAGRSSEVPPRSPAGRCDVLVGGVRDLFARYVAEVAALRLGWTATRTTSRAARTPPTTTPTGWARAPRSC